MVSSMKRKQQIIQITVFLATVIFSFINLFLLPDIIAMQWYSNGTSNFLSKNLACIIPIGVNLVSLAFWRYSYNKYNAQFEASSKSRFVHQVSCLLFSVLGIIINALFLMFN